MANELEHRLVLPNSDGGDNDNNESSFLLQSHLAEIFTRELPPGGCSSTPLGVAFELWSKSLYPNVRERLVARAHLPLDKLVSTASYVLPLVDHARIQLMSQEDISQQQAGQLFVAVSYRCEELTYNLISGGVNGQNADVENFLVPFRSRDESECVTLSVGVLRAYGLESAASEFLKRHASGLVSLENSNLYVKFSLGFLNRPQVNLSSLILFYRNLKLHFFKLSKLLIHEKIGRDIIKTRIYKIRKII